MEAISTFSEDLLEQILCRLTVRQLLQLRCASKLWCSLLAKNSFCTEHYQYQFAKLIKEKRNIPLFSDDPFGPEFYLITKDLENIVQCLTPDVRQDSAPYFSSDPELFSSLLCSDLVNGIVLFHMHAERLALWNPATREFRVVPHPRLDKPDNVTVIERFGRFLGMGFDPKSYDFRIVRETDWTVGDETNWKRNFICEMYSLKANCWKSCEFPWPSLHMNRIFADGYFNGVHYWPANIGPSDSEFRFVLLSFDFTTEMFKLVEPPPPINADVNNESVRKWEEYDVGKYMEFLAITVTRKSSQDDARHFDLWIAREFDVDDGNGVPSSWQHLFTVGPVPAAWDELFFHAFLVDGDVLVNVQDWKSSETTLYNPTTQTFKQLGVGVARNLIYVESLFRLSEI